MKKAKIITMAVAMTAASTLTNCDQPKTLDQLVAEKCTATECTHDEQKIHKDLAQKTYDATNIKVTNPMRKRYGSNSKHFMSEKKVEKRAVNYALRAVDEEHSKPDEQKEQERNERNNAKKAAQEKQAKINNLLKSVYTLSNSKIRATKEADLGETLKIKLSEYITNHGFVPIGSYEVKNTDEGYAKFLNNVEKIAKQKGFSSEIEKD